MAYYSSNDTSRYHECRNCTSGNSIEKKYLTEGKPAGGKLCNLCGEMQGKGNCTPGTPTPAK